MPQSFDPWVAVPARNEAQRLPGLVAALATQTWQGESGRILPVVIALNNCQDDSASLLQALGTRFPSVELLVVEQNFEDHCAHAGSARRLAMETACAGALDLDASVLLTTDADAVPEPDWVAATLAAIASGADVATGALSADRAEEDALGAGFCRRAALHKQYMALADRLSGRIDPLAWDPMPRHHDHSGGSIAVRANAYRAVGGLRPLPFREDLDLIGRLRGAGYRIRHAPEIRVTVSARVFGRASGGMADCIKQWIRDEAEGRPMLVESPLRIERRAQLRHAIRTREPSPADSARLIERLAPDEPDAVGTVPIERAIQALEARVALLEAQAHAA